MDQDTVLLRINTLAELLAPKEAAVMDLLIQPTYYSKLANPNEIIGWAACQIMFARSLGQHTTFYVEGDRYRCSCG